MNKGEVIKLLTVIEATYPSYKVQDRASVVEAWAGILEPYDAAAIGDALVTYTRTNPSKYAPAPAELIGIANRFNANTDIGIEDHIANIRRAIRNSSYNAQGEFDALDRVEQRAVGSPDSLRAWARQEEGVNESVTMSHLRKSLAIAEQREQELAAMPENRRLLVERTLAQLSGNLTSKA